MYGCIQYIALLCYNTCMYAQGLKQQTNKRTIKVTRKHNIHFKQRRIHVFTGSTHASSAPSTTSSARRSKARYHYYCHCYYYYYCLMSYYYCYYYYYHYYYEY